MRPAAAHLPEYSNALARIARKSLRIYERYRLASLKMKHVASWIRECDLDPFANVFQNYPDLRIWNARIEPLDWHRMEGLLLTGGSDISEGYLNQPVSDKNLIEDADPERDAWEFGHLPMALAARMPIFAICRGLQVLNVALGGTLFLDVPGHDDAKYQNIQELRYFSGANHQFPRVNSSHHQALDRLGEGVVVEARCVADDIIEQAHLGNYPFAIAVQYHPERDSLYRPLFDDFFSRVSESSSSAAKERK
jgi:putative glutamine amidotransferase